MSYLIDHALKNVWGNARLDRHHCFKMALISTKTGFRIAVPEPWGLFPLPKREDTYVIYSLGALLFESIGLPNYGNGWINVAEKATQHGVEMALNVSNGRRVPSGECWLRVGNDGSMLLAIRRSIIMDHILDEGDVTWSSYRNPNADKGGRYYTNSRVVTTDDEKLLIYQEWLDAKEVGHTNLYHNGILKGSLVPGDVEIKDSLHYECRNYSIHRERYALNKLNSFNSELDLVRKYLVHLPGDNSKQHYRNDIDLKLLEVRGGEVYGVDLFRLKPNDVRMVTHADVSVSNDWLQAFINLMPSDFTPTHLEVTVKDSGMAKKPWFDCNLVNELYLLPSELIYQNMIDETNKIPEWNVVNLENSSYPRIMEAYNSDVTEELVIDGYGYTGVVQAAERNPILVPDDAVNFSPPHYLSLNSSFICYDKDGLQIALEQGQNNNVTVSKETVLVDGMYGSIGKSVDAGFNNQVTSLSKTLNYRHYMRQKAGNKVIGEWVEAVEGDDYYIVNDTITWYVNLIGWETLTLSNAKCPLLDLTFNHGQLWLNLDDVLFDSLHIPLAHSMFGSKELWQGNRRLIQGVDYSINGKFIFINSKEHASDGQGSVLEDEEYKLLFFGLTNQLTDYPLGDTGFVTNGTVSQNHRYNTLDGMNGTFIVNGKVYERGQVKVDELSVNPSFLLENGKPYQFFTRVATCNGLEWDSNGLLEKRNNLLKRVEDYVTSLSKPKVYPVAPINRYYYMVSGTLNKMIADIQARRLIIPHERIEDVDLIPRFITDYQFEIDNDVCLMDFGDDEQFIEVHPSMQYYYFTLTPVEFDFISRVNRLVLNGKVNLGRFITVGGV